jgi:hypothetical protein
MRLLAAWLSNPIEYWPQILLLIAIVTIGVWSIRKLQARRR